MRYVVLLHPFRRAGGLVDGDHPTHAVPESPLGGILLYAGDRVPVTFFVSEQEAKEAIARTVEYGHLHNLSFTEDTYELVTEHQWAELEEERLFPRQYRRRHRGQHRHSG